MPETAQIEQGYMPSRNASCADFAKAAAPWRLNSQSQGRCRLSSLFTAHLAERHYWDADALHLCVKLLHRCRALNGVGLSGSLPNDLIKLTALQIM